jgi:hypothetical protein
MVVRFAASPVSEAEVLARCKLVLEVQPRPAIRDSGDLSCVANLVSPFRFVVRKLSRPRDLRRAQSSTSTLLV